MNVRTKWAVIASLLLGGCSGSVSDAASPLTIDSSDASGELQAHMTVNGVLVSVVSTFVANGDVQTRVVSIRDADGTLYAERDIDLAGGAPAGSFAGQAFGHPGDSDDANQALWSGVANSAAGQIIAAVGRASTNAALTSPEAQEPLDEVAIVSDTLERMAGKASASADNVGETASAQTWCGPAGCPRVGWWNYVCASSASMWPSPNESGNAPYELCGGSDAFPDPVYVYDTQHGGRAAHVTAITGPHNRCSSPFWPARYVSGYLNIQTLCACRQNTPHSCSPY